MNIAGNVLSAVFWGLLFLSLLVFVHEGGHYLMARLFGVRVTEFYLGLPCRFKLFHKSKTRGTEVGVTPLLLGGYNRICGMEQNPDELSADVLGIVQREGRVEVASIAQELGIDEGRVYSILASLTDLAAVAPYYNPELDERPDQRDYPAAFQTVSRDANMLTEYDAGHDFGTPETTQAGEARPVEDAHALLDRERSHTYIGISVPKRIAILVAGPLVNLLLAFLLVTATYMTTEYHVPVAGNVLESVESGSAAESAGLVAGDSIKKIGDVDTTSWGEVRAEIDRNAKDSGSFDVTYVRDGAENVAHVSLSDAEREQGRMGVTVKTESYHLGLLDSMRGALNYAGMVGSFAVKLIMPQHTMEVLDQSSSVVGISVMASQAAASGFADVIAFIAAISMSLGFMNLLPIPPLDGGKILIELIQVVIRKPLSMKAQTAVSYVGLAFFLFIFFVAVRNDVFRFIIG